MLKLPCKQRKLYSRVGTSLSLDSITVKTGSNSLQLSPRLRCIDQPKPFFISFIRIFDKTSSDDTILKQISKYFSNCRGSCNLLLLVHDRLFNFSDFPSFHWLSQTFEIYFTSLS